MAKHRTILFDVDGVLADFCLGFTQLAGVASPWGTVAQKQWQFDEQFISPELRHATWERVTKTPGWWETLEPLVSKNTIWSISWLQQNGCNVVFCTNREGTPSPQVQTAHWLQNHGFEGNPHVILSKRKGEIAKAIDADYAIDDKPENVACIHWIADAQPCKSYVITRPYNLVNYLPAKVRRVDTVNQFLSDIQEGV